jgi:hypothetical protein
MCHEDTAIICHILYCVLYRCIELFPVFLHSGKTSNGTCSIRWCISNCIRCKETKACSAVNRDYWSYSGFAVIRDTTSDVNNFATSAVLSAKAL